MVIAISTIILKKKHSINSAYSLEDVLISVANENPQHQFVFIVENPFVSEKVNVSMVEFKKNNSIGVVNTLKLQQLISKIKPQLLLHFGESNVVTSIPQIVVYPLLSQLKISNKQAKNCLFIANSLFNKKEILENNKQLDVTNIDVVYEAAADFFKPLMFETISQTKDGFADGREYFFCTSDVVSEDDFINILKAFSLFKKWQHSNMKLLIAGNLENVKNIAAEKIKTYKYKEDIVLLGKLDKQEIAKLTASAYCVLFLPTSQYSLAPVFEAMQCGTPVIASNFEDIMEVAEKNFLYSNPKNFDEIAAQMQIIYKDENLRSSLIKGMLMQAKKCSYEDAKNKIWQHIQQQIKGKD